MAWVLDHLDDLESDFSVFHRMSPNELYEMPGPRFFAWAERIAVYGGVIRMRIEAEQSVNRASAPASSSGVDGVARQVPSTAASLRLQFGDDIEVAEV